MQLPTPPADGKKYRILVIDDEAAIAKIVLLHLQMPGFEGRYAPDGELGWECFEEFKPHLVVLDVLMPHVNGWELIQRIRKHSSVPVIMMSAADSDKDQIQGLKLGADDYIPKPIHPPVLLARVVANLRRVYRYDADHEDEQDEAQSDEVATDWPECNCCGYLGPAFKFEAQDPKGNRIFQCPNCQGRHIKFKVG